MSDPRRRRARAPTSCSPIRAWSKRERVLGRALVKSVIADAQQRARAGEIEPERVAEHAVAALPATASSLRPVVNATGVVVHTNLGRAPLSRAALDAVVAAAGATDVEFDLATGRRARRGRGALAALARAVPTAGGVHVVNNNAAALLLTALALAPGKEIVLSRGELVEIGDGFRIPELLASTGSRLREVGTTNRTSVRDYAEAIGPETGFVLKVHPSNFHVSGFTSAVDVAELALLEARGAAGGRHRLRAVGPASGAARRARRHVDAAGRRGPGHRERRQTARRPAGRPALRPPRAHRAAAPPSGGARPARGQADAGRAGSDPAGPAAAGGPGAGRGRGAAAGPRRIRSPLRCPRAWGPRRSTALRPSAAAGHRASNCPAPP